MTIRELSSEIQRRGRSHLLFLMSEKKCDDNWQELYEKAAQLHGWDEEEPLVYATRDGVETVRLPCYYQGNSKPYVAIGLALAVGKQSDIEKEVAEQFSQ